MSLYIWGVFLWSFTKILKKFNFFYKNIKKRLDKCKKVCYNICTLKGDIFMPFKKITKGKDRGKYKSPSGRVFTKKQVKLYYSTNGFKK